MGLIHWWDLNNSLYDKGSKQKNMIAEKGATFQQVGKTTSYSARYTSGADHYIDNDLSDCDELSFACWVKLDTTQSGWGQIFTVNSWTTAWENIAFGFDNRKDTQILFTMSDGTNYIGYDMPSNSNLQDGTWHHLVGTYKWDGSQSIVRLYVDGVEQDSSPKYFSYKPALSSAKYISVGNGGGEYITGNVNDARIYDHCLSNVEIKNLSRALVLHYNFEDLYTPLEYLESSGTQYINPDVGFVNGSSLAYELKCQYPTTTTTTGSGHHRAGISSTNGQLKVGYTQTSISSLEWHTAKISWSSGNVGDTLTQTNYVDGVQVGTRSTQPYDSNPYLIFAMCSWSDNTGLPPYSYEKMRIASCKIYRNNTLVRDFIPSLRNIDGKVGLYDKANGTFYTNAGTGDFYYEGCFEPVNYQNASISKNTVTFSKSSDGWGNSGILGKTNFSKGYVAATVAQNNRYIMIGMASVNNSYNYTQGYFIYPSNDGTFNIYEMGSHIGNFGSYSANDRFHVVYDGSKISYYKNATLVREVGVSGKMYMNITNYNAASATIKDVCYGSLEFIKDNSGNDHYAKLQTPSAFSQSDDSKIGEYSLRNVSGDPNARINTSLNPSFISNGTICFWYKKDSSAFSYNSGHFLVATQNSSGYFFGATSDGLPSNSGCSYGTFYLDGVPSSNSNIQDTNWHFYAFTGVNLAQWTSFSMQAHGDTYWLWRGNIADFKIYNTSLSSSDIKDLYETRMIIDNKGNIYCEKLIDKQSSCEFPNNEGLIKATDFMVSNEAQINGEYELLEYIESTGVQYIDTGIKATDIITRIEGHVYKSTPAGTSGILFGLYGGGNDLFYFDYSETDTIVHRSAFGYGSYPLLNMVTTSSNGVGDKKIIFTHEGNSLTYSVNGNSYSGTSSAVFGTSYTHYLFCYNAQGSAGYFYKCRMYSFKIWVNNVLIRDYIPVKRKSDGVIGLFDKVDGILYTNKGSGTFGVGTSKGTCYIVCGENIYENMASAIVPTVTKRPTSGAGDSASWKTVFSGNVSAYDHVSTSSSNYTLTVNGVRANIQTRITGTFSYYDSYTGTGGEGSTSISAKTTPATITNTGGKVVISAPTTDNKITVNLQSYTFFESMMIQENVPYNIRIDITKIEQYY